MRIRQELDARRTEAGSFGAKCTTLESDLEECKAQATQLASSLFAREKEVQSIRDALDDARQEIALAQSAKSSAQQVIAQRDSDIKHLESRLHEGSSRLEIEIGEKQEIREHGRQTVNGLNAQITGMEDNEAKLVYSLEQVS